MNININKFDGKSNNYSLYRPRYPIFLIDYLISTLSKEDIVADIGCGTGILTKQLLSKDIETIGVEPNIDMYKQAKEYLKSYNSILINSSAENTNLNDNMIDLIVVAQALHWFDIDKFIVEINRILKDNGSLAIIYNNMDKGNPIVDKYLNIHRQLCSNYKGGYNKLESTYDYIYGNDNYIIEKFENNQYFDFEQYMGYTQSLSYSLNDNDSNYEEYVYRLTNLFSEYSSNNHIEIPMTTTLAYGKVKKL